MRIEGSSPRLIGVLLLLLGGAALLQESWILGLGFLGLGTAVLSGRGVRLRRTPWRLEWQHLGIWRRVLYLAAGVLAFLALGYSAWRDLFPAGR